MSTKAINQRKQTVPAADEQSAPAPWDNASADAEAASAVRSPMYEPSIPAKKFVRSRICRAAIATSALMAPAYTSARPET